MSREVARLDTSPEQTWFGTQWSNGLYFGERKRQKENRGRPWALVEIRPTWTKSGLLYTYNLYYWSKPLIPVQVGTTAIFSVRNNIKQAQCESWALACTSSSLLSFLMLVWSQAMRKEPISISIPCERYRNIKFQRESAGGERTFILWTHSTPSRL